MLLLLSFFLSPLGADITAAYVPDPYLFFTTGTYPFAASDFVAHLGTLTLTISGNHLFNPSLVNLTIPNESSFTGPVLSGGTYVQQTTYGAKLCSVSTVKNETSYSVFTPPGDTLPLSTASGNYNTSLFVAELYILGSRNASLYKPGELYILTEGNLGAFNVGVAANGGGSPEDYIPINGQDPDDTTPPPVPISPVTTEPLPYIDPDNNSPEVQYFLSIIDETSFDLQSVLEFNTSPIIARAMIILYQAVQGSTYGIDIQFSKLPGSSSFALRPDGNPSGYAIPYQLKFLGQTVLKDESISWTPLFDGPNFQNILIAGISSTSAEAAPSGLYMDTIVVTITPIE